MALPIIKGIYGRMGRTFSKIFGEQIVMRHPVLGELAVDAIVSPGYAISPIRGEASQTRDMWTLSLRREQLASLFGESADILSEVQSSEFVYLGRAYRLDDVVDDTQIMVEGFMYAPAATPPVFVGDTVVTKKRILS